jgi:hypothetical protein
LDSPNRGVTIKPTKLKMNDLLRRLLDDEAAARVRPTTPAGYRATVEHDVVISALRSMPASKLRVADVHRKTLHRLRF